MMKSKRERIAWRSVPAGIAAAILACTFAGIWTSDGAALVLLDPPGGDLTMRVSSLIAYGALFAAVRWKIQNAKDALPDACPFMMSAVIAGIAAYAAGCALMALSSQLDGTAHSATAVAAFFLLKLIGAPLSVALVRLFAQLSYRLIARASALGILGAFVLKEMVGIAAAAANLDAPGSLAVGSVLILLAICIAAPAFLRGDFDAPQKDMTTLQPFGALINRNLTAGVVVASMMLGFLRAGDSVGSVDMLPTASIALVLIAAIVCLAPSVGVHELFLGALMCTASGFLLGPLLEPLVANGGEMLTEVGTALFEVVVWLVAVIIVRSCAQPLLAAAALRLAIVVGHLAGAALGMAAQSWTQIDASAPEAFSSVIVFAYVVMLAYLFNDPVAKLPFTSGRPAAASMPAEAAAAKTTAPGGSSAVFVEAATRTRAARALKPAPTTDPAATEALLWADLCAAVARDYGLTPRETDVLEQLARGRDLAFMEEKFVLSRNTVKMHIKHVYEKLDVHSKQEVIDLVQASALQ